jgi:hypothetical protein
VANQQHRTGDLIDAAGGVGGVGRDAAQRIGGRNDGDPSRLQALDDAGPTRAIGKGAVDEDDGQGSGGWAGGGRGAVMANPFWLDPKDDPIDETASRAVVENGRRPAMAALTPTSRPSADRRDRVVDGSETGLPSMTVRLL